MKGKKKLKTMKLHYYSETDSLYIDFSEKLSVDSKEIAPGVVLDFDSGGNLVGIDIDHASRIVDLSSIETEEMPIVNVLLKKPIEYS